MLEQLMLGMLVVVVLPLPFRLVRAGVAAATPFWFAQPPFIGCLDVGVGVSRYLRGRRAVAGAPDRAAAVRSRIPAVRLFVDVGNQRSEP
jgi:hypothetical protein